MFVVFTFMFDSCPTCVTAAWQRRLSWHFAMCSTTAFYRKLLSCCISEFSFIFCHRMFSFSLFSVLMLLLRSLNSILGSSLIAQQLRDKLRAALPSLHDALKIPVQPPPLAGVLCASFSLNRVLSAAASTSGERGPAVGGDLLAALVR